MILAQRVLSALSRGLTAFFGSPDVPSAGAHDVTLMSIELHDEDHIPQMWKGYSRAPHSNCMLWPRCFGEVNCHLGTEIGQGIVEDLQCVGWIMRECAWVFCHELVIIGRLE